MLIGGRCSVVAYVMLHHLKMGLKNGGCSGQLVVRLGLAINKTRFHVQLPLYVSQAFAEIRHFRKCLGNSGNAWTSLNCLGISRNKLYALYSNKFRTSLTNLTNIDVTYKAALNQLPVVIRVVQIDILSKIEVEVALYGDGHDVTIGQGDLDDVVPANQVSRRIGDDDALRRRREVVLFFFQDLKTKQKNGPSTYDVTFCRIFTNLDHLNLMKLSYTHWHVSTASCLRNGDVLLILSCLTCRN